jgi:hypothetical protein
MPEYLQARGYRPCFFFLLAFLIATTAVADDFTPSSPFHLPGIISIEGQQAPWLLRQSIALIRVYAYRENRFELIPFQIDERDQRNRWALDQGPQPKLDDSPGVFDENDVLVLMHCDLGQRGPLTQLPKEGASWVDRLRWHFSPSINRRCASLPVYSLQ